MIIESKMIIGPKNNKISEFVGSEILKVILTIELYYQLKYLWRRILNLSEDSFNSDSGQKRVL